MKKLFTACLLLSVAATAWAEKTAKVVYTPQGDYSASLTFHYDEESHEGEGDVILLEDRIRQVTETKEDYAKIYYSIICWDSWYDKNTQVNHSKAFQTSTITTVTIAPSFKEYQLSTTGKMFYEFKNCTSINGLDNLNTENVDYMGNMFGECESLKELDLRSFNTENVYSMSSMFSQCSSLSTIYASSKFDVSECLGSSEDMFDGCYNLVGGAGTTYSDSHTDGKYAHIDSRFNPGYFTGEAESIDQNTKLAIAIQDNDVLTFYYKTAAELDVITGSKIYPVECSVRIKHGLAIVSWPWNGSEESDVYSISHIVIDPSFKDFELPTAASFFENMVSCKTITGLENFNLSQVTDMTEMFYYCISLIELDLSSFDTRNIEEMNDMFLYCSSLTTIYASDQFVVDPEYYFVMFEGCESLEGGEGTRYDQICEAGSDYAHIDGGESNPGYFTSSTGVHTATISDLGYSTLYLSYNAEIPEGVSVFAPTLSEDGTTLRLGQPLEGVIPAKTGVIIKGNADVYKFRQTTATASAITSDLDGTLKDMPASDITANGTKLYVLNRKNDNVGFYRYTGQTLGANKAYLAVPAGSAAPTRIAFEGEENALQSINNDAEATTVYNLQGQRVDQISRPGVYIINGKTSIIK